MKRIIWACNTLVMIIIALFILNSLPNVFKVIILDSNFGGPLYYHLGVIVYTLIVIIIGMLFGSRRVFELRLHEGRWKFDMARLIVIIPLLILSFSFSLYFSNSTIAGIIGPIYSKIDFDSGMIEIARFVTGLQIVNAVYKEQDLG